MACRYKKGKRKRKLVSKLAESLSGRKTNLAGVKK